MTPPVRGLSLRCNLGPLRYSLPRRRMRSAPARSRGSASCNVATLAAADINCDDRVTALDASHDPARLAGRHDRIIIVQIGMMNMQTAIQKPEGILVPTSILEEAGINGIPKIHITKHAIILQSTSNTRRFAGRLQKSPLSVKQLDEAYNMHLLED